VDSSVLIDAFSYLDEVGEHAREALGGARMVGPEHLRVEAFNGIHGLVLGGKLDLIGARGALDRLHHAAIKTVGTAELLDRMWDLRANFSGYDAAYVAAAEYLSIPLVTSDRRLAAAPGPRCAITVV
jgi:predicted nucleic acid-binding protein